MRTFWCTITIVVCSYSGYSQNLEKKTYYDQADSLVKEVISIDPISQKLAGLYKKYHQSGHLAISGYYSNNLPDSLWSFYFESGRIKTTGYYLMGKATGLWRSYYENGNKKSEGHFQNEKAQGEWKYYYENATIKKQANYREGTEIGKSIYFYETGPIKATTSYDSNGMGKHFEYYLSGQKSAEGQKDGPYSTGQWSYYDQEGNISSAGRYAKGKKEGTWISYHANGNISSEGKYIEGFKTDNWKYFHQDGSPMSEGQMKNNQQDGSWNVYTAAGDLQSKGTYQEGTGRVTTFHPNGQIASTGYMKTGLMDSSWNYFDQQGDKFARAYYKLDTGDYEGIFPDGSLRIKGEMLGNKRIGEWTIYGENGAVTGTYHPYYNARGSYGLTSTTTPSSTDFNATKSPYRYQNKVNRYFDEVVNEFNAWIVSSNPLLFVLDRIPLSIEYYHQQRLGYEMIYHHNRSPFTFNDSNIDIEDLYSVGHSLSLRQKFYSKAKRLGMYYFGHQVFTKYLKHGVETQEIDGFRNIITSTASESVFSYGWMIGWKFMQDAGEPGLSIDAYLGANIGVRAFNFTEINDERAYRSFSELNQEPLAVPLSFGLNIGWAFEQKKKKKRRK